jgi:DNA-binding FrmR family transcriptional regulator
MESLRKKTEKYPYSLYTIPGVDIVNWRHLMSGHEREKVKLLQRLRKLRGQLDAVERSLEADEDCGGQLMLLAAVRGGVNGLMGEGLETHIRFHLVDGAEEEIAPELAEDLIDLVRAYLK